MDKRFYPRLALDCIRKNGKFYLPYLFTVMGTVAAFYILDTTAAPEGLGAQTGFSNVQLIMRLCTVVLGLVCGGFLLYTNALLMKQRSREFGLYSVLGMNRVNLTRLMLWETVFTVSFGLGGGLVVGLIFDRLLLLCLSWMIGAPLTGPVIYWKCLIVTTLVFGAILLVIFAINVARIGLRRPVDLMRGANTGDREPKARWLLALLGAVCLGYGYYLAIITPQRMTDIDSNIIFIFFRAVLMVIVGTYLLFLSGSVTGLKLLRRWKGYYYKANHFISVSGLIHRMGRNAAGLASICILCTTVLVMVSSTTCLYAGIEADVNESFPRDVMFSWSCSAGLDWDNLMDDCLAAAEAEGYHPENVVRFIETADYSREQRCNTRIITADGYSQLTGRHITLEPGQVMLSYDSDHLELGGTVYDYAVADVLPEDDIALAYFNRNVTEGLYGMEKHALAVVPDEETLVSLINVPEEEYLQSEENIWLQIRHRLEFDVPAGEDMTACQYEVLAVYHEAMEAWMDQGYGFGESFGDRAGMLSDLKANYGGLLFLGLFLGVLFLAGASLIIYYKQMVEGHEDRDRFAIMEKVGLDRSMASKAIHSQILLVFFLPLVTAVCHMAAAFPLIKRLLLIYGMDNTSGFLFFTAVSIAGFAVIYTAVYLVTAKTYSKLVGQ